MKLPQYNMFLQCINSAFKVQINTGVDIALNLRTVTTIDEVPSETDQQNPRAFSLVFEGALENFLPQAMYQFSQPDLGEFELFIVPIGPTQDGSHMRYEAIFN